MIILTKTLLLSMTNSYLIKTICGIFSFIIFNPNNAFSKELTLNARNHQNKVILNWVTTEAQNTVYLIQRSADNKIWENIQQIKGYQTAENSEYYFSDVRPTIGKNNYRIKQVVGTSESAYSNTVQIQNTLPGEVKMLSIVADKASKIVQIYSVDLLEKILILDEKGKVQRIIYEPTSLIDCSALQSGNYRFVFHKKDIQEAATTKYVSL